MDTAAEGASIYRHGLSLAGDAVRAEREQSLQISGHDAACVNCHRRSGLGGGEGRYVVPPITGNYLFAQRTKVGAGNNVAHRRSAYTDATLVRAIREGIDPDGNELGYLMPRFKVDDAAANSLVAYLKELGSTQAPGVTDDALHFATIITPDADPVKRRAMLEVLEHFFANKNAFFRESPRMQTSRGIMYRIEHRWRLHVWELKGAPATWEKQLHDYLAAEPVFAVISGVGGKTWAPVHRFCEQESLPCLFPNVDLPEIAEQDFYSIYFSKGVLLEAELIAKWLGEGTRAEFGDVVQIFRRGDIGAGAAARLDDLLRARGIEVSNRALTTDTRHELIDTLRHIPPRSVVVLWLRGEDIAALPPEMGAHRIALVSGLMAGLEHAPLPANWRKSARMTYPFDLPDLRRVRMNYPVGWLKIQRIPVLDERVEANTYLACSILADTLGGMFDTLTRDYLVERIEDMLSRMLLTGYFPRLSLAPGQRFASKGGYVVHLAGVAGAEVAADGDWLVP